MEISVDGGERSTYLSIRAAALPSLLWALDLRHRPAAAQSLAPAKGPRNITFGPDGLVIADQSSGISQTEPGIAVNPSNPQNLVAGFFEFPSRLTTSACRFASSTDGGHTWAAGGSMPLQDTGDFCSDPSISADATGSFYYAYAEFSSSRTFMATLLVAKSTDGGRTFPTFSIADPADPFLDKPYLAVDTQPRSKFEGTVYVSFSGGVRMVISRDGGLTWSSPTLLPSRELRAAPRQSWLLMARSMCSTRNSTSSIRGA